MKTTEFTLVPFSSRELSAEEATLNINISVALSVSNQQLQIQYLLSGPDLHRVRWPKKSPHPVAKQGLWQHTCFELFISESENRTSSYQEYNFSPSRDWATFLFEDYRQAVTNNQTSPVCIEAQKNKDGASLHVKLDLPTCFKKTSLAIGITAVVETIDGELFYFALTHTGEKPDFHRRDSFIGRIEI